MVSTVTDEILEEGWLLCFDEMQVLTVTRVSRRYSVFGVWERTSCLPVRGVP